MQTCAFLFTIFLLSILYASPASSQSNPNLNKPQKGVGPLRSRFTTISTAVQKKIKASRGSLLPGLGKPSIVPEMPRQGTGVSLTKSIDPNIQPQTSAEKEEYLALVRKWFRLEWKLQNASDIIRGLSREVKTNKKHPKGSQLAENKDIPEILQPKNSLSLQEQLDAAMKEYVVFVKEAQKMLGSLPKDHGLFTKYDAARWLKFDPSDGISDVKFEI